MAITNFIPEIWNAQMLLDFRERAIAANLVNREYEGDATRGNTVHITSAVNVAVKDYKAGAGGNPRTTVADPVSDAGQDLLIDQEKNFDFYIDDIDRAQAAGSMEAYTESAAEGLAEDADKFILALAVTGADPGNIIAPAALTTGDQAFNIFRELNKRLNKAKAPKGNRVAVVNAEFEALLLGADSKLTSVDVSGTPAGLRDAVLGRLLNFLVVSSENLPNVAQPQIAAWYRPSIAYVSQIEETEALRGQDKFADRLRGLHVYGGKVIRPTGVATFTATP
ncbi:P22 phage major capsid protein family protein [Micromonospora deserti]|uniref:P22 coat protein-protein 5 domain protein n=1 Tax=Micromonospora deserti TaxID=2070366 RepID=A0A2W2DZR2_9ACTN|nr:P22 phage major capsid protein family protein [Micromonospora deserti]PZF98253.1 hypothetical protein C1I99_13790 [Micromonospora deserti]